MLDKRNGSSFRGLYCDPEFWQFTSWRNLSFRFRCTRSFLTVWIVLLGSPAIILSGQIGYSLFYPKNQLLEDLKALKGELEAYHPGCLDYITQGEFDGLFVDPFVGEDSVSYAHFYRHVSKIPYVIGDAHLGVAHSSYVYNFVRDQMVLFPFSIYTYQGDMYINKNLSSSGVLGTGVKVLSINGKRSSDLLDFFTQFIPRDGQNDSGPRHSVSHNFNLLYAEYEDTPSIFQLRVEDSTGRQGKVGVLAQLVRDQHKLNWKRYRHDDARISDRPSLAYEDMADSIGILTVRTFFVESWRSDPFFQNAFGKLRRRGLRHLILDLRDNGGGDLGMTFDLLSYLIHRPIMPFKGFSIKANTREGYQTRTLIKSSTIFDQYHRVLVEPQRRPFEGKIYVLVNGMTASASVLLTQMLRTHTDATIIGQEAGANPYLMNGGSMRKFTLPNTRIRVRIPLSKISIQTDEQTHARGLMPDIFFEEEVGWDLPFDHMKEFVLREVIGRTGTLD